MTCAIIRLKIVFHTIFCTDNRLLFRTNIASSSDRAFHTVTEVPRMIKFFFFYSCTLLFFDLFFSRCLLFFSYNNVSWIVLQIDHRFSRARRRRGLYMYVCVLARILGHLYIPTLPRFESLLYKAAICI